MSRGVLAFVIAALAALSLESVPGSVTTCDAANPFDRLPDDVAIKACLDDNDWVLLKPDYLPGYVGYIINDTLKIRHDGVLLTTAENPRKVKFIAGVDLADAMLRVTSANNYEISFIRFDGDR